MTCFIGEGLKAMVEGKYSPNFNVLNVIRSLLEDKGTEVFIPYDYKNDTVRKHDPKVHYLPYEAGRPVKVTSIVSNKERFNFSLNGVIDVATETEPDENGMVDVVINQVFRSYHIIRDGVLEINRLVAKLSENAFTTLRDSDVLWYNGMKVLQNHKWNPDFLYKIDLTNIPLVSLNWARPISLQLYDKMVEEVNLMAYASSLRKAIKEYKANTASESSTEYSHDSDEDSEESAEKKTVKCIVYEFKGLKGNEVDVESVKEKFTDLESAQAELKRVTSTLSSIRFVIRCIVFAIESSSTKGNYQWTEKKPVARSKNKFEQTCEVAVDGVVMTLRRLEYEKEV